MADSRTGRRCGARFVEVAASGSVAVGWRSADHHRLRRGASVGFTFIRACIAAFTAVAAVTIARTAFTTLTGLAIVVGGRLLFGASRVCRGGLNIQCWGVIHRCGRGRIVAAALVAPSALARRLAALLGCGWVRFWRLGAQFAAFLAAVGACLTLGARGACGAFIGTGLRVARTVAAFTFVAV